jgi:hypothetical protein
MLLGERKDGLKENFGQILTANSYRAVNKEIIALSDKKRI